MSDSEEVDVVGKRRGIAAVGDPQVSLISSSTPYTGVSRGKGSYHAKMAACRVPGERPLRYYYYNMFFTPHKVYTTHNHIVEIKLAN